MLNIYQNFFYPLNRLYKIILENVETVFLENKDKYNFIELISIQMKKFVKKTVLTTKCKQ